MRKSPGLTRRGAIGRILGAASVPIVTPVARALVSPAWAAERRCAVILVIGEGLPLRGSDGYMPVGLAYENVEPAQLAQFDRADLPNVTLSSMFAPLEPHKSRLALIDGLYNDVHPASISNHGQGFGTLTGVEVQNAVPESSKSRPGGISFDQFLARRIGASTPVPALLFGMSGASAAERAATTFAAGANQPIPHIGKPSLLLGQLTGAAGKPAADPASPAALAQRRVQKRMLDLVREDIKRLEGLLAGPEREALTPYLEALTRFDEQQAALAAGPPSGAAPGTCMMSAASDGRPDAALTSMFQIATTALRCGLTNVVGVSVGHGFEHNDLELFSGNLLPSDGYGPHGGGLKYRTSMTTLYRFIGERVAQMFAGLGPVASQTVVLMVTGTGAAGGDHHGKIHRFPAILLDGTGKAKTGGRYLRYASMDRPLVDLYDTVAHLVGAPTDTFGAASRNRSKGPLTELL